MEHLKMQTPDIVSENMAYIAERWPECLTEAKDENGKLRPVIDFDKLRQVLSSDATGEGQERYQFTWPDKRHAIRLANAPTTDTLRPCREDSTDFDNTQNLYIEGDNLDVLKLLRESYLGKVKMIYIDPPYNTGGDFVYKDNFIKKNSDYAEVSGAYDEEGNQVVDEFEKNSDSNGRFHTDWLNMIYPRLKVARDLLTEDGAIFISIGDDEEANLIKVCDEILGERNFIASICHKHRASVSNDRIISENHNHLVFYAKDINKLYEIHKFIGEDPKLEGFDKTDENGDYKLTPVDGPGGAKKGNPYYEFHGVTGYWRYSKETMQQKYDAELIVVTENNLQQKLYKSQAENSRRTVTTWWDDDFLTSSATSELQKLMDGKTFDNPKNVNLLLRMLKMITYLDKNAIILDFFSGSATTAHATMQQNADDGGKRKYICVQLPEETPEDSEARKAGYATIPEIAKERIRRAGKKIKEEHPDWNGDTGFRVLKLDSSNMENVFYTPAETTEHTLFDDNIKPNRTDEDLLFQVMMELGMALSDKIEKTTLAGKTVWNVGEGYLMACFEANVTEDTITAIAKQQPQYFVMADRSLASDNVADNFEQIFNEYSESTVRRII